MLRVAMEWLLGDEDVWSGELEYRLKRAITFDSTVGSRSNFTGVSRIFFLSLPMEWLLGDGYVLSTNLEYWLPRAITFDPTVGSRLIFYSGFQRLFSSVKLWNRCSLTRMSGRQP